MRRAQVAVVAAVLVIAAMVWTQPALGDKKPTPSDKQAVDKQLAQAAAVLEGVTGKAQQAAAALARANAMLPGAKSAVARTQGQVAAAQVVSAAAQRAAAQAKAALAAAAQQVSAADKAVTDARDTVGTFAADAYKGISMVNLGAILEAESPSQLATNIAYLDQVSAKQRRALNAATQARQSATEIRNAYALKKQAADAAASQAAAAVTAAQAAAAAATAAQTQVQTLITQQTSATQAVNAQRANVLAQVNRLQAESNRIAAQLNLVPTSPIGRGVSGGGSLLSWGYLMKPVNGWKSSDFGYRYDPYYRVWQLHAGTDIAAPHGTPIYAAAPGRVVRAGWNGGYGNYTCIYHGRLRDGRGVTTCYGHQSAILVDTGDYVRRGQVIGRVGTTGASTGNHLHFEVRLDGTPVNPLRYLAIS
ncbi:M23 family metallopeptidase [Fodinicola acaciae]|uniref:M23 family metallopeptidase n=1 Tax=Fodinicola acaciae TaxID=2681555 RepID=UPI0013D4CDA8|nr:M23 family metallopeptidase [Fodinicola acaciae]